MVIALSRPVDHEMAPTLFARIVKGIETALPTLKDPEAMMQQANALISAGATRYVDTLELWGDSFASRHALRPVARTIVALYDRASVVAGRS